LRGTAVIVRVSILNLFNPDPRLQLVPLAGHTPVVVVDNFVRDPQALVDYAIAQGGKFANAPKNAFPGMELRMPEEFSARLNEFFIEYVKKPLGVRRSISMYSRLSMITLQPHELAPNQRVCHRDHLPDYAQNSFSASVLYLFKNPAMGGTSFYAPKSARAQSITEAHDAPPGYMTQSNDDFELIGTVPAAWNRVIFYDGCIFHSGHVTAPELLSSNPAQGRLTINGFFTGRKAAT